MQMQLKGKSSFSPTPTPIFKDWNSLLKSLAQLVFCIPNKTQENAFTSHPSTTMAEPPTTVSVMVGLTFDFQNGTDPPNGTHLGLTVSGTDLGLKGGWSSTTG